MKFNGDRMRVLRRFHDLSQRELGETIGSPASTITAYERGRSTPKGLALDALCAALNVQSEFFFDWTPFKEYQEPDANFRSLARTPAHLRDKIVAHASLFGLVIEYLTKDVITLPEFRLPSITVKNYDDIEQAAERCRIELGVGAIGPIGDVIHVAEHAGVVVTVLDKKVSKEVDAFSLYGTNSLIVLNPAKESATRMRFDVAHEIAHGSLHRNSIPMDLGEKEDQAHYFASAFLMPKRSFAREFWNLGTHRDWPQLFELKERWGVSVVAIIVRAYQLGLIDAAEYRRRCKMMSKRGWFRSPEPMEPACEVPQLFGIALRRFSEETGKGAREIASELNWTPTMFTDVTGISTDATPITTEFEATPVTSFEEFRQRKLSAG
ncbi:MAG: ImmA/IrrE family metallo-endopeptidase [Gemmatimonadaceae bacterium]|nr:ImmA/IrrE family metallo-endopeptidase [Gemmatimonadaceae bacterium]